VPESRDLTLGSSRGPYPAIIRTTEVHASAARASPTLVKLRDMRSWSTHTPNGSLRLRSSYALGEPRLRTPWSRTEQRFSCTLTLRGLAAPRIAERHDDQLARASRAAWGELGVFVEDASTDRYVSGSTSSPAVAPNAASELRALEPARQHFEAPRQILVPEEQ
jgi:hypothetical protein